MVRIKKDRDITIFVLALFILAFMVFLFTKSSLTGMVTSSITSSDTQLNPGESLVGKISLSLKAADKIPQASQATLYIIDSTNAVVSSSSQMTMFVFFGKAGVTPTSEPGATLDDSETTSPEYDWEKTTRDAYTVPSDTNLEVDISDFSGLNFPSTAGTYTLLFNLSYSTYKDPIQTKSISFTVNPSSDTNFPQITNINFKNENGSSSFRMLDKVNCSATVKDDGTGITVNYIMWGSTPTKTSITSPGKTGSMDCTGTWSSGKICSVSTKVDKSDLGYWNCTIQASDGTNTNYSNSSVLLMTNSPPQFKKYIENLTWNINENNTELDLTDYFKEPDDQTMNYTVSGNDYINISIKSNGDVLMIPDKDWIGSETVVFKARDEKGAETESNDVLLNVTVLLNCTPTWLCGNWSDCIGGTQTRSCASTNNCTLQIGRPLLLQNCTGITITCAQDGNCKEGCSGGDPDCSCTVQYGNICGASQNCSSPILHSGTGICCSTPCSSTVNTLSKSQNSGFFSSQTNKILVGVGSIAGIVFIITLIILISTYIDKKKAVVEEKPVTEEQVQQKLLDTTPVKIKPTNIDKMKDYMEQSLANKVPMRIIKGELTKVGWTESDIDSELNIARLRNYIQIKLNQGIPRAEIEQSLRMKGWSQDQINEASKNTKVRPLI